MTTCAVAQGFQPFPSDIPHATAADFRNLYPPCPGYQPGSTIAYMSNINEIPPSVLASWPKPNTIDPERRTWMPAFAMTWQVASTLLVWGRFYLRARRIAGPFGIDDLFMLIAWLSSVAFTTVAWIAVTRAGVDRHTWDVPIAQFPGAAFAAWILQVLMLVSSGATKASVLLFYRRLVVGTLARRWKLAIYFALVFHALYLLGITLGYVLICRPLQAYWMSYDYSWNEEYTCTPGKALNPVIGVLSIFSDIYAVVLPFVILRYYCLDIPRSQKIGLNIIFAMGLLVAGAGIGRTYYLIELGVTYDTSWVGFNLMVWSVIELQLGIICACTPSLRAFFRRYLTKIFSNPSTMATGGKSRTRSDHHPHQPTDSVHDSHNPPANKHHHQDPFDSDRDIDLRSLTRRSLEEGRIGTDTGEARERSSSRPTITPHFEPIASPPPAYQSLSQSQSQSQSHSRSAAGGESYNSSETARWESESTRGCVGPTTAADATRWNSNSTATTSAESCRVDPLRQNPITQDVEVSGGMPRAQSVRSAV